jgi:hypothetical protein
MSGLLDIRGAYELADRCVTYAAHEGYALVLLPGTPVVPDEYCPYLTERGTWGELHRLAAQWASIGCRWVNLRFAIEDDRALVRYEAKPDGEPLPPGQAPAFNGGFDIHRIIGQDEFLRRRSSRI